MQYGVKEHAEFASRGSLWKFLVSQSKVSNLNLVEHENKRYPNFDLMKSISLEGPNFKYFE